LFEKSDKAAIDATDGVTVHAEVIDIWCADNEWCELLPKVEVWITCVCGGRGDTAEGGKPNVQIILGWLGNGELFGCDEHGHPDAVVMERFRFDK
jgi:hypothetical protein